MSVYVMYLPIYMYIYTYPYTHPSIWIASTHRIRKYTVLKNYTDHNSFNKYTPNSFIFKDHIIVALASRTSQRVRSFPQSPYIRHKRPGSALWKFTAWQESDLTLLFQDFQGLAGTVLCSWLYCRCEVSMQNWHSTISTVWLHFLFTHCISDL